MTAGLRPAPVTPSHYSADRLQAFAGGAHAAYLAAGGRPLRPRLARSLALAALAPGLDVVDVGVGRGEAAVHTARRGARVLGLDYSPGSLSLARATLDQLAPPGRGWARLVAADATALPLADGSVDRVLLLDVIEHLHPWQVASALAEVRRILRPGGYVVVHTLPNRWALAVAYPALRLAAPGLPAEPRSDYERAVHVNEQDPSSLRVALTAAGLSARVWVEAWTTRQAVWSRGRSFPDAARRSGYPVLARPGLRRLERVLMATPARWVVGNDLFALAWRPDGAAPPVGGRFRPIR